MQELQSEVRDLRTRVDQQQECQGKRAVLKAKSMPCKKPTQAELDRKKLCLQAHFSQYRAKVAELQEKDAKKEPCESS